MRVCIISAGYFPVPAVKGGAVENIIENIINENELYNKLDLSVLSCYDKQAKIKSDNYLNTEIMFVKIPHIIKMVDKLIFVFNKKVIRKKKVFSYRFIIQRLWYIKRVSDIISKGNYDRLVFENHPSLLLSLKFHRNFKRYSNKYIYHIHNSVKSYYGCEKYMKECSLFLGVSNFINKDVCFFMGLKYSDGKFKKLANRIDEKYFLNNQQNFDKREIYSKLDIPFNSKIVLFTGRISTEKGVLELIKAFNNIIINDIYLVIVGSSFFGSDVKSKFMEELKEIAIINKEYIRFTGYIEYTQMYKFYSIATIVVLPSIWEDPAPLTVIETIISKKPLITTDSGGIPEYANSGCAIVLERNESIVEKLTDSINSLLSDKERCEQMTKFAESISDSWTIKGYYDDFVSLVEGDSKNEN